MKKAINVISALFLIVLISALLPSCENSPSETDKALLQHVSAENRIQEIFSEEYGWTYHDYSLLLFDDKKNTGTYNASLEISNIDQQLLFDAVLDFTSTIEKFKKATNVKVTSYEVKVSSKDMSYRSWKSSSKKYTLFDVILGTNYSCKYSLDEINQKVKRQKIGKITSEYIKKYFLKKSPLCGDVNVSITGSGNINVNCTLNSTLQNQINYYFDFAADVVNTAKTLSEKHKIKKLFLTSFMYDSKDSFISWSTDDFGKFGSFIEYNSISKTKDNRLWNLSDLQDNYS